MLENAKDVIFGEAAAKPILYRYSSLFPGFGFALGYKVSQRIYKFGGQPVVNDFLWSHSGSIVNRFGESHAKTLISAISGRYSIVHWNYLQ